MFHLCPLLKDLYLPPSALHKSSWIMCFTSAFKSAGTAVLLNEGMYLKQALDFVVLCFPLIIDGKNKLKD